MFGTSTRSWRRRAKRYFRDSRVPFREIDVGCEPREVRDVARKTGRTGVPPIEIWSSRIAGEGAGPQGSLDPVDPRLARREHRARLVRASWVSHRTRAIDLALRTT